LDWPNRHVTFIVAKKLNLQFSCSIYGTCGGWLKTSWGEGLKLLKNRHMVFERFLVLLLVICHFTVAIRYKNQIYNSCRHSSYFFDYANFNIPT